MDAKEIAQNIITILEKGWNNGSGSEFATPFAAISEFVHIRGVLLQNTTRQTIAGGHQELFSGMYKGSSIAYNLIQAIHIDQNTILANVSGELNAPTGPLAGKNNSIITLVLTKLNDNWEIRAFHNTLVAKQ